MARTLVTGGSGFLAAHIVDVLLKRGHSVVTTVRSAEKGDKILEYHSSKPKPQLRYVVVPDIAEPGAFDKAVVSDPPFEAVIHAASPYHFQAKTSEAVEEMLTTAINGTVGILKAVKAHAPSVRRVVVTSSFAAMVDTGKSATYKYSEKDWDPVTREQAHGSPMAAYRCSKTLAERAAWDFVEEQRPNFSLAVCNPPLIFGPIIHDLKSLDSINTSNIRFRDLMNGALKSKLTPSGNHLWVDVRDIAQAHVLAVEKDAAGGKRFFVTAGNFNNVQIVKVIEEEFPQYKEGLPMGDALKSGDYPAEGVFAYDNSRSLDVLGIKYRDFRGSVIDTVKSLQPYMEK